jgi:cytochrome c553
MGATIAKKDSAGFGAAFLTMTSACNKCHAREDHGFVNVKPPTLRTSLVTR